MRNFRSLFILGAVILGGLIYVALSQFGQQSMIFASGKVELNPNLIESAQGIRTLFITLFDDSQAVVMPWGAIKYQLSDNPKEHVLDFVLTKDNVQVMRPEQKVPEKLRIKARLDRNGLGGKDSAGDLVGEQSDIGMGDQNVHITIDRKI